MTINWKELPYNHSGRWEKKFDSIMAPGEKVAWPQFIAEMVIYWRSRVIKDFPKISKGKGWSNAIQKQVRDLNQQAATLCNYSPHPDDEPLVVYAVRKYFRTNRPLKIGGLRKARVTKAGKLNITQAEKDIVLGITNELKTALETRESFTRVEPTPTTVKSPDQVTFNTEKPVSRKKNTLAYLLEMEKQIKSQEVVADESEKNNG